MSSVIQGVMRTSLLFVLAGCAPDLTALEHRQRELENELSELDRELESLRTTLQDAGIDVRGRSRGRTRGKAKSGKAKLRGRAKAPAPSSAHPSPTAERSAEAGVTVVRTGAVPELPRPAPAVRTPTECGFKLDLPALKSISDFPLNSRGMGKSGPVLLELAGAPLTPHAFPKDYEETCAGAFRHAGTALLFSPNGSPEVDSTELALSLDERVPMPRGDDKRPMYWVFPGTELVVTINRWDGSWGDAQARVTALVTGTGEATFQLGDEQKKGSGPTNLTHRFEGAGPHEIRVRSPEGGPYVVLDGLSIGNADNAVVVTGGQTWQSTPER